MNSFIQVNDILIKEFNFKENEDCYLQREKIVGFLKPLVENQWVYLENSELRYPQLCTGESGNVRTVFNLPIHLKLSTAGYDRLHSEDLENMMIKTNESNLALNSSMISLNTKTETFYEKQEGYSKTQKRLTLAIAIATGLYTFFTILTFWKSCNIGSPQQSTHTQSQEKLQHLSKTKKYLINYYSLIDSSLHKGRKSVQ